MTLSKFFRWVEKTSQAFGNYLNTARPGCLQISRVFRGFVSDIKSKMVLILPKNETCDLILEKCYVYSMWRGTVRSSNVQERRPSTVNLGKLSFRGLNPIHRCFCCYFFRMWMKAPDEWNLVPEELVAAKRFNGITHDASVLSLPLMPV